MKLAITASILSLFVGATALAQSPSSSALSASAPAQEEAETITSHTQGGPARITGWFVAPTFASSGLDGALAYSPGLRGGVYLNRHLAIGVAMNGLATEDSHIGDHEVRDVGTYGGLLLQYVVQSNRLVHASVESTLGSGRWCVYADDNADGCQGRNFLVFEPVANLEINVAKHLRVATGVGYRFAVAGSGEGPTGRDMSSLVARTSLVFGSF